MVVKRRVFWQSELAERWRRTERTLQRWRKGEGGRLPPPDVNMPNGREAWSDTLVEAIEQGEATAA